MKKIREKKIINTIFLISVGILLITPIYFLVVGSFKTSSSVFNATVSFNDLTLEGIKEILLDSEIPKAIWNSLIVSTIVTVVAMLFHAMAGYALARLEFPGKSKIFIYIISTLMVPFPVIMIPLYIVTRQLGMANSYAGIIIPMIFNAYGIFLFRQFYLDFPKELEEAAYVEGLSKAGTFFRLVLPLSKSVIVPLTIGFFTANWNNYLWPLVINQNQDLDVVQVALAKIVGGGYETTWNLVLAAAFIAAVPTFILFFFAQEQLVQGISTTGIK